MDMVLNKGLGMSGRYVRSRDLTIAGDSVLKPTKHPYSASRAQRVKVLGVYQRV